MTEPTTYTTTNATNTNSFSVADLQRAYDLLKAAQPPVWYSTTPYIDRGKLYVLSWCQSLPELHVIHEGDEAAFCEAYPHARHVRQRVSE